MDPIHCEHSPSLLDMLLVQQAKDNGFRGYPQWIFCLPAGLGGQGPGGSAITSKLEMQLPPFLVCNFLRFYYATITDQLLFISSARGIIATPGLLIHPSKRQIVLLRVYIRPRKQFRIWLGQHFRFGKRFNIRDINELYWYDKTKSITHSKSYGFLYPDENTITVASGKYTFRIPVSDDYSPEDAEADAAERKFEMDPVYGQSVTAAAENARAIYEAYEGLDNYERLWNYKNEIRNLSGYNRETSGLPYGNP